MLGLMMDRALNLPSILEYAAQYHGDREIVVRTVEGPIFRYDYARALERSKRMANALIALGVKPGDRVATLAWSTHRHFELYYAVSGIGAILHTINPRLHPDQIAWIANHAGDEVLCFDMTFLPIIKAIQGKATTIKHYVALCDADKLPADTGIPGLQSYEAWIGEQSEQYTWPEFDENSASSMCYTSGTTGNPKGVLLTHANIIATIAGAASAANGVTMIAPYVSRFTTGATADGVAPTVASISPVDASTAARRSSTTPLKATCGLATSGSTWRRRPPNSRRRPSAWPSISRRASPRRAARSRSTRNTARATRISAPSSPPSSPRAPTACSCRATTPRPR